MAVMASPKLRVDCHGRRDTLSGPFIGLRMSARAINSTAEFADDETCGGCHCGAVRYEVETELGSVMSCNCSICQKRGALLTFVPAAQFTLLSGEDDLTDYQFNKKIVHHLFCGHAGSAPLPGDRTRRIAMVAVNVRCLDDVDLNALTVQEFDGKSL